MATPEQLDALRRSEHEHEGRRPMVLILYTGGTMGMKHDASGALAPVPGYFTEQIMQMEELQRDEMPQFTIKEYDPLLDSACMEPKDWVLMANDIEQNYYAYDGFVVIMGTDTMAYAASALSFMLENLGKTVIFTGSQIPFAEVYNDARRNLIVSIIFAVMADYPEVCIFFNDRLLRANRSSKISSMALGAFESPNFPPLATLGVNFNERKDLTLPPPRGPFRVHRKLHSQLMVIRLTPGFNPTAMEAVVLHAPDIRAIVLEMFGTGNAPSNQDGLLRVIREAKDRGILVVAASQCLKGGAVLDKYELGRQFSLAGVVAAGDMTVEAVATKLMLLMGRYSDNDRVARGLLINMRGELSAPEQVQRKFYSKEMLLSKL